ncbi:uncharacterized protein LOC133032388 [Cannabis sativa]|uniref:uncharacterized protein LOC133032388 n=1 Tax=Cannabis sativa TaxID=3483 RepID=UPI0029C9D76A|nr:uncharacterized protein LOC133032388 [Cannabis sativa]
MSTLYHEMKRRYSERKNIRHTWFQEHYSGDPNDLASVIEAVPDHCTTESWKQIIDLFLSPKFRARSNQNKKNRGEMQYLSTQGSRSMAASRNEHDVPEDYVIDTWKKGHLKKGTEDTWISETCKELHEKMLEEVASMTDTEDDSSDGSASKYKQLKAMNKVLGSRSDYLRGLGYKLKGNSTSSSSTQSRAQSQVPTSSITPEDMGVFAEFMLKMRDKIDQSGTSSDPSLHDPRFNNFLEKFLPSQPQGSASSSAPPPTSMPQQQQQQQPRSPQQPQFFQQQQQHSPNMSGGSSQSPQLHYMFGLPSQSPPIFFSKPPGGSQTQPMVGNIGGSSQQPYPVYGQFGSLLQQQPVYGQMGGSPQQPMYGGFFSAQSQQQQQQPILVRPHPRQYVEILPTPQTGQPYYPAPPAQSRENIDGSRLSSNADEFLEFTDLNNDS